MALCCAGLFNLWGFCYHWCFCRHWWRLSLPLLSLQEEHLTRWPLRELPSLLNGSYFTGAQCSIECRFYNDKEISQHCCPLFWRCWGGSKNSRFLPSPLVKPHTLAGGASCPIKLSPGHGGVCLGHRFHLFSLLDSLLMFVSFPKHKVKKQVSTLWNKNKRLELSAIGSSSFL